MALTCRWRSRPQHHKRTSAAITPATPLSANPAFRIPSRICSASASELAYRLCTICERKKRAAEALAYNGLVQSWPEIVRLAREGAMRQPTQGGLFEATEA